jgi:PilZ domain
MAQTPLQTSIAELRAKPRLKSLIAATIVYNNGQCTLDCVIRNISETGAKLSVPASVALPDRFDLTVPQRSATYRAHIAWQRPGEIGVLASDRSRHETAHSRA